MYFVNKECNACLSKFSIDLQFRQILITDLKFKIYVKANFIYINQRNIVIFFM